MNLRIAVFHAHIGRLLRACAWTQIAAAGVCSIVVAIEAFELLSHWQSMPGWEALEVAQSVAGGHGFSFPGADRWLFDVDASDAFYATAWVDPIYTGLLSGIIWVCGEYYRLAAAILNLSLLAAVFMLTYRVCRRLMDSRAALVAVVILALVPGFAACAGQMNNTMLATALILVTADTLISFAERPDTRRSIWLGLALGMTALACPSAELFLPLTAVLIWLMPIGPSRNRVAIRAGTVLLVALTVISPWMTRNYAAFGEFVPTKTGSGQISFVGTVAAGATVQPDTLAPDLSPPWRAKTPGEAIYLTSQFSGNRQSLESYEMMYARRVGGDAFDYRNEAQRDAWFRTEAEHYILANPLLSTELAAAKLERWIFTDNTIGVWLCAVALLGAGLAIQQRSAVPIVLAGWVASYVAPFLLIVCYFNRYRAPIDPILVALSIYCVRTLFVKFPPRVDLERPLINASDQDAPK